MGGYIGSTQGDTDTSIKLQNDDGSTSDLSGTQEGHAEVAIHDPLLPFGAVHTENLTPIFQADGVYGVNAGLSISTTSGTGGATSENSSLKVSTGTTILSQGVIQSRKRLRYRAGQGAIIVAAAKFSTPVAYSYQLIGAGHAEDGYYFGYGNTNDLTDTRFGILYVKRGVRETRTLTISAASSHTENVTVKLNGVDFTVAVTNAANIQRTVWEISQGTYAGWSACVASSTTVIFVSNSAGAKTGAYSLTGTSATGSFAQTKAGAASTDTFIPQSSWNGDKLDGTGKSGVTIDPTKGNIYRLEIQYLGYGPVIFKVEVCPSTSNNPIFVIVHSIKNPNTLTDTHVGNPAFPFTMAAYSAGSTTDVSVNVGSYAGFIEGRKVLHGNRYSYLGSSTAVDSSTYRCLFTILNTYYFGGKANQAVINFLSVACALKHNNPCIIYLIKNGSLAGNPSFSQYSTGSCSYVDTSATTLTFSNNNQIIWSGHLGDTGDFLFEFTQEIQELTLQPGEWVTLAAKSLGAGSPSFVTGSLNTREDI